MGTIAALAQWTGDFEKTSFYLLSWPTTTMPFLVIGAVVAAADTQRRVVASFAFVLLHFAVSALFYRSHAEGWWVIALLFCVLMPQITLPRIVTSVVMLLAAHSLIIYLSHHATGSVFSDIFGRGELRGASVVFQLAFGVLLGIALRPLLTRLGIYRLADIPLSFQSKLAKKQV
ncbi:hypothetical protein [Fluviibacterium sp. S390]|uniref:hypothetical protein n=1 Tax=Fluviibacterium sp. S390 TaxID=3415139 RepID=UPI003C7D95E0